MTILQVHTDADLQHARDNGYDAARDRSEVLQIAPWAAEVLEVDGVAWIAYESAEDARIAQQQT